MKKILSLLLAGLAAASMASVVSAAEPEAGVDYIECVGGVKVWEWVEGYANEEPDKLFDYDETTKWCHGSAWSYVVWEMPNAVEITGYQLVTANDNETNPDRNPLVWTIFGCNDYDWEAQDGSWEEIHRVDYDVELPDTNYTPTLIDIGKTAPSYKYYMWEIEEIESSGTFQMSGLNLLFDGQAAQEVKSADEIAAEQAAAEKAALYELGYVDAVVLNKVEGIVTVSGTAGAAETEGPEMAFDYDTATKWCVNAGGPFEVIWEMPNAVAITGYQLSTANDTSSNPGRNPKNWTLSGSADGNTWTVIDEKVGDATMLAANYVPFDFMLASAAPEYKFFKFECTATADDGSTIQLSEINLIFDGAVAEAAAEEVVEEPAAEEVVEVPAVEETVEEPAVEEPAVEEPAVEEVVETPAVEETVVEEAPQTFDFGVIAAVSAVVSLAGYAISKKR